MSTLTLWSNPFTEFGNLMRWAFGPDTFEPTRLGFTPAAEMVRDGDDAIVRLELPGVDITKDVTVEVDAGNLVIRGERRDERSSESAGRTMREVRYGSFRRSFILPEHVDADAVTASYDAGVLSVRVPGAHTGTGGRRISITSGGTETTELSGESKPATSEKTSTP